MFFIDLLFFMPHGLSKVDYIKMEFKIKAMQVKINDPEKYYNKVSIKNTHLKIKINQLYKTMRLVQQKNPQQVKSAFKKNIIRFPTHC